MTNQPGKPGKKTNQASREKRPTKPGSTFENIGVQQLQTSLLVSEGCRSRLSICPPHHHDHCHLSPWYHPGWHSNSQPLTSYNHQSDQLTPFTSITALSWPLPPPPPTSVPSKHQAGTPVPSLWQEQALQLGWAPGRGLPLKVPGNTNMKKSKCVKLIKVSRQESQ